MLRLISFILALGGLAVSALGIWLMMGNELPTDLFAGEEPQLERKLLERDAEPVPTDSSAAPEIVADSPPETQPEPIPEPVVEAAPEPIEPEIETRSEPVVIVGEAFEAIEPPTAGASPEPVSVMPTPKKDTTTGTMTRSLPGGDVEVSSPVGESQPAMAEPPAATAPSEEIVFDPESVDFDAIEPAAGVQPPTLAEQLYTVPIAYETPVTASFNTAFTVTLSLNAQDGATTATGGLSGSANTNIAEAEVQVSDLVRANLIGIDEAFQIVPENDKPQKLSKSTESVWRWKVTPLKTGSQRLKFEIFAVNVNNIEERLLSFDDTVTVEVSRIGQAMFLAQQYNPIVVILAGFGSLLAGIFGVLRFFKS